MGLGEIGVFDEVFAMMDAERTTTPSREPRGADRVLEWCEDVVYLGIAALLLISSGVLLVVAVDQLMEIFDELSSAAVVEVLDTLLLVFILVELLSAVRRTLEDCIAAGVAPDLVEQAIQQASARGLIPRGSAAELGRAAQERTR